LREHPLTSNRMEREWLILEGKSKTSKSWAYSKGCHGLLKVSLGPAMPYPSTPCGRATPETAFHPFQGWPALQAGNLGPFYTPLDSQCHRHMLKVTLFSPDIHLPRYIVYRYKAFPLLFFPYFLCDSYPSIKPFASEIVFSEFTFQPPSLRHPLLT
jgi:hypothetical protein